MSARPAAAVLATGLALPALAGAACVAGFAPLYGWPVPLLALAALFAVWSRSGSPLQAGLSGFAFGLGLNLAGVSWVFVSLHEFGHMPAVLAAVATFLFCAYLALFPAAAGWIAVRFAGRGPLAFAGPAAWLVLSEWVRGWLFTGFPWLALGYTQVPQSPLAGFAPVAGAYGVSLALALSAALLAATFSSRAWSRRRAVLAGACALVFAAGGALKLVPWTQPAGASVEVALLQGNVSQHLKWREDVREKTLRDYARAAVASEAKVVILPETALPAFLDQLPPGYLAALGEIASKQGKAIFLGTVEREFEGERFRYYNSVVALGEAPARAYRKRHLVPFGEFIPPGFGWIVTVLKIPLTDFARGPAGQPLLEAAGVRWGAAICYEDIFGEEVIEALPAAGILFNVSNDAWFGESLAADQHLQFSQMRALETGRWMVRATNTGVTAAIDETGRVVSRLPAFVAGELRASPVPRSGTTPYAAAGNLPALLTAVLLAVLAGRGDRGNSRPAARPR